MVTSQQVGGSLGVALLSTLFADAVSGFTAATGTPPALAQAQAAVHGYRPVVAGLTGEVPGARLNP